MHIESNTVQLVDMFGDGATQWHNGQLIVEKGGVRVSGGGETIFSGGLVTQTTDPTGSALSIFVSRSSGYIGV